MSTSDRLAGVPVAALVRVLLVSVLSGLAAWSFRVAFDDTAGHAVLVAVAGPVVVAAVWGCAAVYGGPRVTGTGVTVLVVLVLCGVVAAVTAPGADFRFGPSRLLTGTLPAEPYGPELATVSALAGVTALIAVRLAHRPDSRLLPLVSPTGCLLLGLGLGAAVAPLPGWFVPAFAVIGVLVAAAHVPAGAGRIGTAWLVSAVVIAVGATTAGTLLGPVVAAERVPASMQALVDAPVTPREDTNPLARYLALRNEIIRLELTGTASRQVDLLRMVTFDQFDGQDWLVDAEYRRAGTRLPAAADPPATSREVTLDVEVETPGVFGWLPRAGRPSQVSVSGLGFDAATGDIVVPAGRETPTAYQVVGSEPVVADQVASDAPARTDAGPEQSLPLDVDAFLRDTTIGKPVGRDQLLGIYDRLTGEEFSRDTSDSAPSGNGLYQITQLVQNKHGTSEQYASAFAVLCRAMGWDARVVLGFRPQWSGKQFTIEGPDVFAWVEVRFERSGWITVNPTPSQATTENERDAGGTAPPGDDIADAPRSDQQLSSGPDNEDESTGSSAAVAPRPSSDANTGPVVAIASVALLVCVGAVPVAKRVRRARLRRVGTPRQRAMAAWREVVVALRGADIVVARTSTAGEIVGRVPVHLASTVSALGNLVDRAMFAPEGIDSTGADDAWRRTDDVRARLSTDVGVARRLRNAFDPRPLLPRRAAREYQAARQ